MNSQDLVGQVFNRLNVISIDGNKCVCRCECGNEKLYKISNLLWGYTKSCGCYARDITIERSTKHGMCYTSEYNTWRALKERCLNPAFNSYRNYGARGIHVDEEWKNSFEKFIDDMGPKPAPDYTIDRIDVNGDYCKDNCKWASTKEQSTNRRNTIRVDIHGEALTLPEIAERTGINIKTIQKRYYSGKRDDDLIKPVK